MEVTASQLMAHMVGDYLLQSDWMAQNKTNAAFPAIAHAVTYSIPFLFFEPSAMAIAFIIGTHYLIDRYRLARYVVYAKNRLSPPSEWLRWNDCKTTGYASDRPLWLSVWLLIIADNILHVLLNAIALSYL